MTRTPVDYIQPTRLLDPLQAIAGKSCMFCMQPAVAAVINATSLAPACEKHARKSESLGYPVVFPEKAQA